MRGVQRRPILPPRYRAPLGGCSAATLRCVDARDYRAELRPCCRGHIRQIVADLLPLMTEQGIPWWADYGTLLGAVRNPMTTWADYPWLPQEGRPAGPLAAGILPHDKDGDFGLRFEHWGALMRVGSALERKGYQVIRRPFAPSVKVRLSPLNQTNVDLFCWREGARGQLTRRTISVDQFKGREFPRAWVEQLTTVEWEGLEIPAPADPVAFCAFRYGPNWRTPIPANHDGVRR